MQMPFSKTTLVVMLGAVCLCWASCTYHTAMYFMINDVCNEAAVAIDPKSDLTHSPLRFLMQCVKFQITVPVQKYVDFVVEVTKRAIQIAHDTGNHKLEEALRRQLEQFNKTLDTLNAFDECVILRDLLIDAHDSLCVRTKHDVGAIRMWTVRHACAMCGDEL